MPINADNSDPNKKDEQEQTGPQALSGSGQVNATPTNSRIANFSSGQSPNQGGSGRFTNLQKYIGANQGSGERLGSRIGSNFDRNLNEKTKDINNQNAQISQNVQSGRNVVDNEGQGFQQQLSNIGNQLGTFQNMENRGQFDQGTQSAQQFTQQPNFNQFQNIQAGTAIDNDMLTNAQNQANVSGQKLQGFTGDRLNQIKTEQGRYGLLQDSFNKNRNPYSAGSARLDNLFLQAAPSTIQNLTGQFNQGNLNAKNLNETIANQGQNVNTLLNDESNLITGLNTQAQANQDLFNTKLGDKGNIDYINKLRNDKYNEYVNQLKTGNVSDEVSNALRLNDIYTYQPGGLGINPMNISQKMSGSAFAGDRSQIPLASGPRNIRTYNTNLGEAESFLKKGQQAQNMQDITSDEDYAGYQALQNIAKRDTGKLSGASNLDKAVQAQNNLNGQSLADVITGQDQSFKDNFANKRFSAVGAGFTQADDKGSSVLSQIAANPITSGLVLPGSFGPALAANLLGGGSGGMQSQTSAVTPEVKASLDNIYQGELGSNYDDFYNRLNAANGNMGSRGGVGVAGSTINLDDYFNSGNLDKGTFASGNIRNQGIGTSAGNSRQAVANASNLANDRLKAGLDAAINSTGARNQININQDSSNNEILQRAKRFSRLV